MFDGGTVGLFLVGSALERADFRDVDIRLMLADSAFDAAWTDNLKVRMTNRAVSTWGRVETGLPIDFQIQRMTEANERYPGERNAMGIRNWRAVKTSGVPS
jgi:hypothetical protein